MKKAWITAAAFAVSISLARADDFSNNFTANLNDKALDAFAEDIGSMTGGASFHSGKALGFPLGIDAGVHAPIMRVQDDNAILRDDGRNFTLPWLQVEYGLPGKIDLIARGGEREGFKYYGGGLRYGLLKGDLPGTPSLSLSALYNQGDHDYFDSRTLSANLVLSVNVPIVHPYIGIGVDRTDIDPTDRAFQGAGPGVSRSIDGSASTTRIEAGVNLSLIPFTYITLGGGVAGGQRIFHAGLGMRI